MQIKKGDKLYVRVDHKVDGKVATDQDFQDHLSCMKKIARERYFIGGGFSNVDGGMILFEAKNFEEANNIFLNDPIIARGLYRYDIFEWDLAVLSDDV